MKNLWTPWRMEHILGQAEKYQGCIFEAAPDQRVFTVLWRRVFIRRIGGRGK
jgi:hypothetical protein